MTNRLWIPELDGLRALAALAVVLYHYEPVIRTDGDLWRIVHFLPFGPMGVVFFFVLSSFLLTTLGVAEFDRSARFDVLQFYVRRALRIWPLYFTALACAFVAAAVIAPVDLPWVQRHAWLWYGFLSNWSVAFNHVGAHRDRSILALSIYWSLAVEEQFYLVFPLVLSRVLTATRWALGVVVTATVLGPVCRAVFLLIPTGPLPPGTVGGMYEATSSYLDVFLAGCIAGWITARGLRPKVVTVLHRTPTGTFLGASIIGLSVLWREASFYPYASYCVLLYPVTACVFAAGILWVAAHTDSIPSRLLRSRPLRTLGVLSYGIYLLHPSVQPVARELERIAAWGIRLNEYVVTATGLVLYVGLTIGAAALTYRIIERPFLSLKKRAHPSPAVAAAR